MEPWENNYRQRGALWQGAATGIPSFSPGTRVLETGCGNGKTLSTLCRDGCDATGCDIATSALGLARAAVPAACLVQADVRSLPFSDAAFDAVLAVHIIGALGEEDRCRAAAEFGRVLVPGGTLFFREFSVSDFRCGKGRPAEKNSFLRGDGVQTHYFTHPEVRSLFPEEIWEGDIQADRWEMRVRGVSYPREVFSGLFRKINAEDDY
ncbi:class I SAM-dependent methyltransferase [Methanogenium sp. MK-MG]|uniref:class I SAM-dependent methyltransferase n=1 Tax=Methanogenium sp. MK-MG TaxID=2599926 RepID=UPI0013EBDCCF|nr:class I SAM-dependent methyltransferase [Methanogenium sp. MK-MG]KAF1078086.1 Ubiquinone/menaquinone biosynthesis C-methyltransferase UbiE [Methanogenium sp. MK-MG]